MIRIGTLVKILYPDYLANWKGTIQGYESGYWIIKLERDDLKNSQQSILVFLEKSNFEVL